MEGTMRAAVFTGEYKEGDRVSPLEIRNVPIPQILRPDHMIGKILVCSICGTDVHMTNVPAGYPATKGTILGHELVAEVVEVGSGVTQFKVGDRFVVNPNEYCGTCHYCKNNLPNECETMEAMGIDVDGGFAEYVRVAEKMAFKVPENLDTNLAAYAEPLACIVNGAAKLRVNPAESVCVIGAGPIGLIFIQLLKAAGAKPIISVEPNAMRRDYALKCGADYVIDPINENTKQRVDEITGGYGVKYSIDVVGNQFPAALDVIGKGGTVLLMGNNARANPPIIQSQIVYKEARILGTWLANASFEQAVNLLASGVLNLEFMITGTYPLEQVNEAIQNLREGKGVEVLVDPRL